MENSVLERINKVIYNNGCSITFLSSNFIGVLDWSRSSSKCIYLHW